jgi:hypothetical protein
MNYYEYYKEMLENTLSKLQNGEVNTESIRELFYYLDVDEKVLSYCSFGNIFDEIYFNKNSNINLSADELIYIQSNAMIFRTQYLYDSFGNQCDWIYINLDCDTSLKDITACALIKIVSKIFIGLHCFVFQHNDTFSFGGYLPNVDLRESFIISDWFKGLHLADEIMNFNIENYFDTNLEQQNALYLSVICENSSFAIPNDDILDVNTYDDYQCYECQSVLNEVCGIYNIPISSMKNNDKIVYSIYEIYDELKNVGIDTYDEVYFFEDYQSTYDTEYQQLSMLDNDEKVPIDESILDDPEALWNFFKDT